MPKPAPLRFVKRCRFYSPREHREWIPHVTRGVYVLYHKERPQKGKKVFEVRYIGVAGVAGNPRTGIHARLKSHVQKRKDWTHYSVFEVHDNVSREEVLEFEGILLRIFRHDPRIELENLQKGLKRLLEVSTAKVWKDRRSNS